MATSRDYYEGQPPLSPRPSRMRRIPGHLEDFQLGYPLTNLQPSTVTTVLPPLPRYVVPPSPDRWSTVSTPAYQPAENTGDRIQRLEARWQAISQQMRELETEMSNVRLTSYPQSAVARPYYPYSYAAEQPQYSSLPQLERICPSPAPSITPAVRSPSRPQEQVIPPQTPQLLSTPQVQNSLPVLPLQLAPPAPSLQPPPAVVPVSAPGTAPVPPAVLTAAHPAAVPVQPTQPEELWPPPPPPVDFTSAALLAPLYDPTPPGAPIQPVVAPIVTTNSAPRYSQPYTVPIYSQPIPTSVCPAIYTPYAALPPAAPVSQPSQLPVSVNPPNMMEMAIASSFGIPKPKLSIFSSGKESDFLLLKKGLDSVLAPHSHLTEDYKYQVLLDHLRFPAAVQIAKRYINSTSPYTSAMTALQMRYGQPRQLVQGELKAILNAPPVRSGDYQGIEDFAATVGTLVGMLSTMEGPSSSELCCGSHVDTLLTKLPPNFRDSFAEHCFNRGIIQSGSDKTYTLPDFAEWLERKVQTLQVSRRIGTTTTESNTADNRERRASRQQKSKSTAVLLGSNQSAEPPVTHPASTPPLQTKKRDRFKPYCPYCNNQEHYLNACTEFTKLTSEAKASWIKEKRKCWRCGRGHSPANCTLKKPCSTCGEQHLPTLHEVALTENILTVSASPSVVYIDHAAHSGRVMLKVVPVRLLNGRKYMDTYAVLDDGSERTVILPSAVRQLGLKGQQEVLSLRTIRQEIVQLKGATVSFQVVPRNKKGLKYNIDNAFTATELNLAEQSCSAERLQRGYNHLKDLPLPSFNKVKPMVLIGSDHPHLITPKQPIRSGPIGGPIAVFTALGWAVQGPASFLQHSPSDSSCFHLSVLSPSEELQQHVEKLWQIDTLPFRSSKEATRSGEDKAALEKLEQKSIRVSVDGVSRYAVPLLRRKNMPLLHASPNAVMPLLRATERRLSLNPEKLSVYNAEMQKLVKAGYTVKISTEEVNSSEESWFLPHHLVFHNSKPRVVFNCSFVHQQACLNNNLLPGPTLGSSLLAVLLRFREYAVAISGDIRGMFHQVRLLPQDQSLLRFLWRDGERERSPDVYEWRVLPFGTTCSPCCAIYALQRHVQDHSVGNEEIVSSVLRAFYVDNCLQSLPSPDQAKRLIDGLRALLAEGGFDIRQWSCNMPDVISHLPTEAKSTSCELWLSAHKEDPLESTLGLQWNCNTDTLSYRHRDIPPAEPTLRYVYRVLASQYDPLGFLIPYTTRAKVLVQALWKKGREWNEPITDEHLPVWQAWESELSQLHQVTIPRCYTSDLPASSPVELHIFTDASERAYGAVAYLRAKPNTNSEVQVSFVLARSRVAPKKQLSIPRLELCAALSGAQLAKVLQTELTLPIQGTTLWTDSTTVLHWIKSESQQYKVFVGTRIAEIQELVGADTWRYVPSDENPADDITRGKLLRDLSKPSRWTYGPNFLNLPPSEWPTIPAITSTQTEETRVTFCGNIGSATPANPDPAQYKSWSELIQATYLFFHGAAAPPMTATDRIETEVNVLKRAQEESFPAELAALQAGKPLNTNSRLLSLCPEYDSTVGLIRVGGRLRKAEGLQDTIHPIVLSPDHPATRLLIQDYDQQLLHPGPDRVFAEMRRTYWILRGRQAVKKHQRGCTECQRWRNKPTVPRMADLPASRLRLRKPPYWSTGIDCFGPYTIRIGRRQEKRWGIIFKCLTTRCVHLDLLCSMDTDSFLLALRRFVARRGKPYEILCDRATNFRGADRELQRAFEALEPAIKEQLAKQSISFKFNPPLAPHFGGIWEREIKSVKAALQVVLKDRVLPEEVLLTVLIEVEGILNSKPLGYTTSDIADPDPITPNLLLMGRRDASLPQAVYGSSDLIGRRRWKHSQVLADHFWIQFTRNYLPNLHQRRKWCTPTLDLTTDQVVMVIDPQLPRARWPIGQVTKVIPSDDGRIRAAEVDIKGTTYIRPVVKLIPLPEMPQE